MRKVNMISICLLLIITLLSISGCHPEKGSRSSPESAVRESVLKTKEQPTTSEEGEKIGTSQGTAGAEGEGFKVAQEGSQGAPIIRKESDLIKYIWQKFKQAGLRGRNRENINVWVGQIIQELKRTRRYPEEKEDPSFIDFMAALLFTCSARPRDLFCRKPWALERYSVPVFKKDRLTPSQLDELTKNLKKVITARVASLDERKAQNIAIAIQNILFGSASCAKEVGICAFEDIIASMGDVDKEDLLIDILECVDKLADIQGWQEERGRMANITVLKSNE